MRRLITAFTVAAALLGTGLSADPALAGGPNNFVSPESTVDANGARRR